VVASCGKALGLLADGKYALLDQKVTVLEPVEEYAPLDPYSPPPPGEVVDAGPLFDFLHLGSNPRSEEKVADLLVGRSTLERFVNITGQLNEVCLWDLDLIRSETFARMRDDIGDVEDAALHILDLKVASTELIKAGRDLVITLGFGLALSTVSGGLTSVVFAFMGMLDAVYEYTRHQNLQLLASSELLSSAATARRILSREPSLVPLFLALVGVAGDAAAMAKFVKLAKVLDKANLLLLAGWLASEFTESHSAPQSPPGPTSSAIRDLVDIAMDQADAEDNKR
jgi:hypothetical protein